MSRQVSIESSKGSLQKSNWPARFQLALGSLIVSVGLLIAPAVVSAQEVSDISFTDGSGNALSSSPTFSPSYHDPEADYLIIVENSVTSIKVTATLVDPTAGTLAVLNDISSPLVTTLSHNVEKTFSGLDVGTNWLQITGDNQYEFRIYRLASDESAASVTLPVVSLSIEEPVHIQAGKQLLIRSEAELRGTLTVSAREWVVLDSAGNDVDPSPFSATPSASAQFVTSTPGTYRLLVRVQASDDLVGTSSWLEIKVTTEPPPLSSRVLPSLGLNGSKSAVSLTESETGSWTVKLNSRPILASHQIVVSMTSSDTNVATVSPASHTFTQTDWDQPKTVMVTPVNNNIDDDIDSRMVTITHSPSGPLYANISQAAVTVTVTDDDTRGIDFSDSTLLMDTDTLMVSYTVALLSEPTADVTVTLTSSDSTVVSIDSPSLTFTTDNWDTAQTVTATWENVDSSLESVTVTHSAAGGDYANLSGVVTVILAEVENAGLNFSSSEVSADRDTGSATYTVALAARPFGTVTVTVMTDDTVATVDSSSLMFTTSNWDMPQSVTVTWTDLESETTELTVTHTASGGGYSGVSGTMTARLGDKTVERVAKLVLPEVLRTVSAIALDEVSGRMAPGGRASQGSMDSFVSQLIIDSDWRADADSNVSTLAGKKQSLSFSAESTSLWASSGYRRLSVENTDNIDWEGGVYSLQAGVDTELSGNVVVGLSVSRANGDFDYTDNNAARAVKGSLESSMTTVYPYVGWQPTGEHGLWAMMGFGSGEVELGKIDRRQSSDTDQQMAAIGGRSRVLDNESGFRLDLKAEAWKAKLELEGNDDDIEPLSSDVSRYRLMLEGSKQNGMDGNSRLTYTMGAGLRGDSGEGVTGQGFELNGGVRFHNPDQGLTTRLNGRWLMSYDADNAESVKEWGINIEVRYQPGTSERGLSVALKPSWGDSEGSVDYLWNHGVNNQQTASALSSDARVELRVGYGLDSFGGLMTPYVEAEHQKNTGSLRLGALWRDRVTSTSLGIVGQQQTSAHGAENSVRLELRSTW